MGSEKCNYVYARRGAGFGVFLEQARHAASQLRPPSAKSHLPTKGREIHYSAKRPAPLNPSCFLSPFLHTFAVYDHVMLFNVNSFTYIVGRE